MVMSQELAINNNMLDDFSRLVSWNYFMCEGVNNYVSAL